MFNVKNMRPAGHGSLGFNLRGGAVAFVDPGMKAKLDLAQPDGQVLTAWGKQGWLSIAEVPEGDLTDEDRTEMDRNDKLAEARGSATFRNQTFAAERIEGMSPEQLRAEADRLRDLADQREQAAPEDLGNHPEMARTKPRRAKARG